MISMKCPKCGEEIKEGYVYLDIYYGSLNWSVTEPKNPERVKGSIKIIRYDPLLLRGKEKWLRKGYRCEKCGLIIFEEKYTLRDEEEKAKET